MDKGTIVFFRNGEDSLAPAIVIASRKGGPAPKGTTEPDKATFADLCVFTASGPQTHLSVRQGGSVGEWAAEEKAAPKRK